MNAEPPQTPLQSFAAEPPQTPLQSFTADPPQTPLQSFVFLQTLLQSATTHAHTPNTTPFPCGSVLQIQLELGLPQSLGWSHVNAAPCPVWRTKHISHSTHGRTLSPKGERQRAWVDRACGMVELMRARIGTNAHACFFSLLLLLRMTSLQHNSSGGRKKRHGRSEKNGEIII